MRDAELFCIVVGHEVCEVEEEAADLGHVGRVLGHYLDCYNGACFVVL